MIWGQDVYEIQYRIHNLNLGNLDRYRNTKGSYIYFLSVKNNIVYVGQTNVGLYQRIRQHKRHLKFDEAAYVYLGENINQKYVNQAEQYFIRKCNPALNSFLTYFEKHNLGGAKNLSYVFKWCVKNSIYYKNSNIVMAG